MPYGARKGIKEPGQFGLGDILGLAASGAFGVLAAIATDFQQRSDGSALYTINRWVVDIGEQFQLGDVPLWAVMAGLVALGALSVLYFQPTTRRGAFLQGYGILAALMMAAPPDYAAGIESIGHEASAAEAPQFDLAVYAADEGSLVDVSAVAQAKYDVHLIVRFPQGLRADLDAMIRRSTLRGRLHNEDSGETFNLFRNAGGSFRLADDTLSIDAGVPAESQEATLWVRIECAGYTIEEQSTRAQLGAPVEWRVEMRPSNTPLFLQRLRRSYWF
jgi:hypothetical protein